MKRDRMSFFAMTILLVFAGEPVFAQQSGSDAEELNIIEVELESSKPAPAAPEAAAEAEAAPARDSRPIDFSGLGHLAEFSEVSVIQKRFLPKTGRFQLFAGGTLITNDPFFNTLGGVLKGGYFFTESLGIEASYFALSTTEAKATKELKDVQNVNTDNLLLTKSAMTLDVMWVPIYGKMAWFNDRIIPFDLYFSLGGGSTATDHESAGTVHLAAGQVFALTKGSAFRWDFSWNFFNATGIDRQSSAYNNLFLTVGWSWFFPEAKYR